MIRGGAKTLATGRPEWGLVLVLALAMWGCGSVTAAVSAELSYSHVSLQHEWSNVRADEDGKRHPRGPGVAASFEVAPRLFVMASGSWYVEPEEDQWNPRRDYAVLQLGVGKAWQAWGATDWYTTLAWNWRQSDRDIEEGDGQWPVVNFGLRSRPADQVELDFRIGFDPIVSSDDVAGFLGLQAGANFYLTPAVAVGLELKLNPEFYDDHGFTTRLTFRYDFGARR